MLRIVFVLVLVLIFVVPIYKILKIRTTRIKSELEDEPDAEQRYSEIRQKKSKLKADCEEELKAAKKRYNRAKTIKTKLKEK